MQALSRLRAKLSPAAQANLKIRTYDESIRFNITIVNDETCVIQPYLPDARGLESPTLVTERQEDTPGLFETFQQVFSSMWERAEDVTQ